MRAALLAATLAAILFVVLALAQETLPECPALAAWTQAVVDGTRVSTARSQVCQHTWQRPWPRSNTAQHPIWVVHGRIVSADNQSDVWAFAVLDENQAVSLGAVPTGDVRTARYQLASGPECYYALFLDDYHATVKAAYELRAGQPAKAVGLETVPDPDDVLLVGVGAEYKPGFGTKGFEGPITITDLTGRVRARADLPADLGVVGYTHRPLKATKQGFLVGLRVFRKADYPTALPDNEPPTDLLLMQLSEETAQSRLLSARAQALELLPNISPSRAELADVAFLGQSVQDRLAIRRLAWYQPPGEDLHTIELWDYKPDDTAQLIDLIAWYNGPDGMAFEYRVGPDGAVQETPTQVKTSSNSIWPLAPEPCGPNEIVYPHLDGIWKATLP